MLRQVRAFILRDFQMLSTYRFAMFTNYLQMLMNLLVFIMIARLFGSRLAESLEPYGGDFISYIIVGSIGWGYLWSTINSASSAISNEISMGTFEVIFLTPVSPLMIAATYTVMGLIVGTLPMIILLIIGFLGFDIRVYGNHMLAFLVLFVSVVMMAGLGLIFAGLRIFMKRIGASIAILQSASLFFCGVYFPTSVLPDYLQPVAKVFPFYYSMHGMRMALSPTPDVDSVCRSLMVLVALSVISVSLGVYSLRKGLERARNEGTLAYY